MSEKKKVKVYFGSVQHGQLAQFASFSAKVDTIVENLIEKSTIQPKDKVAIKMHLGFRDGYQTIPVFFIRRIVEKIKKIDAFPFVTDNPTAVYNAYKRGYTQETCGCPLIPIAGVKDGYTTPVEIDFKGFETLDLGGALKDADVLIDVSHVKGHGACGYGGAIKNLALGAYSGPTRWKKIHGVANYKKYFHPENASSEHIQKLVENCPYGALNYDEKKTELSRNWHDCHQCGVCLEIDSDVGAIELPRESYSAFQEMMAISTKKVLDTFDPEKIIYLNFLLNITMYCDCLGMGQPPIINDIGIVGSKDIVAVETASLDLIKKEGLIEKAIPPFIKHVDPDENVHPFTRVHGPYKDPYETVRFAEQMGMGTSNYELIEILSPKETKKMEKPKRQFETEPTFF